MIIGRVRAWYERAQHPLITLAPEPSVDELTAARARAGELEALLANEQLVSKRLGVDVDRLTAERDKLHRQLADETDRAKRNARDLLRLQRLQQDRATPCECGGDTELYLRARLVDAEQRAARDRANAIAMDNQRADMRARLDAGDTRVVYRSAR